MALRRHQGRLMVGGLAALIAGFSIQPTAAGAIFSNESTMLGRLLLNPDENIFVGYQAADAFSSVTIWINSSHDSIDRRRSAN